MSEPAAEATIEQPRLGVIELLQVLSLLTFVLATWLYRSGFKSGYWALAVGIALLLGGLPFLPYFIEKPRQRRRPARRAGGLGITRGDLKSLRTLNVPEAILSGIEQSIVGNWYVSEKDLRLALELKFAEDEDLIEKWFPMIRNYARDQNEPGEPTRDDGGEERRP